MNCRSLCYNEPHWAATRTYRHGWRLCRTCRVVYKNETRCPCCGCKLRVSTKDKKHKELNKKLNKELETQVICKV